MTVDAAEIFAQLARRLPEPDTDGPISVPALVSGWLDAGPRAFDGDDRVQLDALCRQIDVRHTVSAVYDHRWKRRDPEVRAAPSVVAGLVAVLLANAGPLGAGGGVRDAGWGLKCVNSALKALEFPPTLPGDTEPADTVPQAPVLRAWALTVLDEQTGSR